MKLKLSEKDLQRAVVECAHRHGWLVLTINRARVGEGRRWVTPFGADGVGFPDAFACRGPWAVALELKVGANKPSAEQIVWRRALSAVPGVLSFVFWEDDWFAGTVEALLRDPAPFAART